jgi:hypothetical protein
VVECTGLENRRPFTRTVGSNPTPTPKSPPRRKWSNGARRRCSPTQDKGADPSRAKRYGLNPWFLRSIHGKLTVWAAATALLEVELHAVCRLHGTLVGWVIGCIEDNLAI